MKHHLLIIGFFFLSTTSIFAQLGFRIGPSAAYIASKPNTIGTLPNNFNFRYKSGFSVGAAMYYGFSTKIGVSSGLYINSKGYRIFNDSNRNGDVLKHNQTYFEIPLNFVYKQRLNNVSFVRENIGVTFCSMLSSSQHENINKGNNFRINEASANTFYPMLNLGIDVGNVAKNGNVFVFSALFRQGFSNNNNLLSIYNNKSGTTPLFNLGFKGSYIGISISYLFNLKNLKKEEEFFY